MESADPLHILESLRDRASERKLRLFACACCRRIWHLLQDDCRAAIEVAERFADGQVGRGDLIATARRLARLIAQRDTAAEDALEAARAVSVATAWEAAVGAFESAACAVWTASGAIPAVGDAEFLLHCRLLRDLFGNPFYPEPVIDPAWLSHDGGAVRELARSIYDHCRFADMPRLADALEAAGCTDPHLLRHCRSGGEHVRGCWVLDLLLGKTDR